jgi:hypothetical protein
MVGIGARQGCARDKSERMRASGQDGDNLKVGRIVEEEGGKMGRRKWAGRGKYWRGR